MDSQDLVREDFPPAADGNGFDRTTVIAHQRAVAAHVAALEARIRALEVERATLTTAPPAAKEAEPAPAPTPELPAATGPDEVAARLRISSMALDGAGREEIRAALAGELGAGDLDRLLDDVLDRLG